MKAISNKGVAVIAMGLKFPGANSVEEYLEVLRTGKETIRFFELDELDQTIPLSIRSNPKYVADRGIVEDNDKLDSFFFGFNPKLAAIADPQIMELIENRRNDTFSAHLIPWSAKSDESVEMYAKDLLEYLEVNEPLKLKH